MNEKYEQLDVHSNMEKHPNFVCMTIYNDASFLKECIGDIYSQTCKYFELIPLSYLRIVGGAYNNCS